MGDIVTQSPAEPNPSEPDLDLEVRNAMISRDALLIRTW